MPTVELIHGDVKAATLKRVLTDATQIVIVSAFTTPAGLAAVRTPILQCAKRGGEVALFLGIDRAGINSPQLVRDLGALLKAAGPKLKISFVVETSGSFLHAKVFAARKKGQSEILVGSFNLTGRGLDGNHEFAAHITGSPSSFFTELISFIDSIDDKRPLLLTGIPMLLDALAKPDSRQRDTEDAANRRAEAKARLDDVFAALPTSKLPLIREDAVDQYVRALLGAGAFYSYDFDLEKLSIPSGLHALYAQGVLAKEHGGEAGTAKLRIPTAVSATFPLVPAAYQRAFASLGKRLGRAFRATGFETPFGFWVPNAHLPSLQARVDDVARNVPRGPEVDKAVLDFVKRHHLDLDKTAEGILQAATRNGIEPPSAWAKIRDPAFHGIQLRAGHLAGDAWRKSAHHTQTLNLIRERLRSVKDKLNAATAIAKLRRLRADIVPVPVDPNHDTTRRLLESMVWAVVEDRGRNTKPAIREFASRLGKAPRQEALYSLSEALLEGVDGAETTFFKLFGPPPYWSEHRSLDDEDDQDSDDD